jgi:hypothetical protein
MARGLRIFVCVMGVLGVMSARAEAAVCGPEPTDMSVAYSDRIECAISPGADTDVYRFSGVGGDRVLAEAVFIAGSPFTPAISLYSPNGTLIGTTWSPARMDVVLPQSGVYTVVIASVGGVQTGDYAMTITCAGGTCVPVPPPPPAAPAAENIDCEAEPTDQFPGFSTRVSCEIATAADTDIYRFTGGAGDRVLVAAIYLPGGPFNPAIAVYAPDGTSLGTTWSPARMDLVLPQSGVYTAVVSSVGSTVAGQYAFTATCAGGSCLPAPGKLPSLTLALTGCTSCNGGDLFTVAANWVNAGPTRPTEIKIGFRLPDGTPANILGDKYLTVPLPAGMNSNSTLFTFPWPTGVPLGIWTIEATLIAPDLGETYSRSTKTFTVVP